MMPSAIEDGWDIYIYLLPIGLQSYLRFGGTGGPGARVGSSHTFYCSPGTYMILQLISF